MARGQRLSDEQIERIKAVFAESGNAAEAARAAGVSRGAARNYIHADAGLDEVRRQKRESAIAQVAHERADFAELLADARETYIRHLMLPEVVASANAKDAATIVGILTDKHQLITGGATARTEASLYAVTATDDPEAAALARAYAARISDGCQHAGDVRVDRES